MVVTDSLLFPQTLRMKVRVSNMGGGEVVTEVNGDWTADKLKLSLDYLLDRPSALTGSTGLAADSMKNSLQYKVLLVRTGTTLSDDATLANQGVRDNDELLFLKRRLNVPTFETDRQREERRVPDISTIRKATAHLAKKHQDLSEEETTGGLDFQSELRRILISLIEASQRILCLNPEAAVIFKQAEEMLNEAPARKTALSESSVKQLTDMGFPENRARKALQLNQQSVMSAMEWLLTNESDPDIDKPLPGQDQLDDEDDEVDDKSDKTESSDKEQASESSDGAVGADGASEVRGAEGGAPAPGSSEAPRFKNILETIRAFQRREFRPNPRALQNLMEMGFNEKESIHALRVSRNNQDAACDWLLSDRKERPDTVDQGLDPNSPVYKAILGHPSVQLGLNSPRCLLAFLQMLENPVSASQWLSDPETGPLLIQVSRIYHSEKLTLFSPDATRDS